MLQELVAFELMVSTGVNVDGWLVWHDSTLLRAHKIRRLAKHASIFRAYAFG
jgi:hypothetical protein